MIAIFFDVPGSHLDLYKPLYHLMSCDLTELSVEITSNKMHPINFAGYSSLLDAFQGKIM